MNKSYSEANMTILYVTRHGETVWNREKRFQGHMNSDLTQKGIQAAELLSIRMEDIDIDYIISSPIKRAYQTAEIVRGKKNVDIITDDGLKEINLGKFEGLTYDEIYEKYSDIMNKIIEDPHNVCYPDGESLNLFHKRVSESIKNILMKYEGKKILIVAHGGVVKSIESYMNNNIIPKDWIESVVTNCSLSKYVIDGNNIVTEFYNDTKHLQGKLETI